MDFEVVIDPASHEAPYEQVRAQVAALAHSGRLPVGTRLPTVRALAQQLGLAVNTVARAYRELETDGTVETRGRAGTFVAAGGDTAREEAAQAAAEFAERVRRLGVEPAEALAMAASALGIAG